FFSSRRRHTRFSRDWSSACALPILVDFGMSFTRAGTLTTVFFVVSGVGQALTGFAVDRYGAARALYAGLALLSLSAVVLGVAHRSEERRVGKGGGARRGRCRRGSGG